MAGSVLGKKRGPQKLKVTAGVKVWQAQHEIARRRLLAQLVSARWPDRAKDASNAARVWRGSV